MRCANSAEAMAVLKLSPDAVASMMQRVKKALERDMGLMAGGGLSGN